jgi:hypothetical protein
VRSCRRAVVYIGVLHTADMTSSTPGSGEPRAYWLLGVVAAAGVVAMYLGASAINDDKWSYVWIVGVGVVQAALGVSLKRRMDRTQARS